MNHTHRISLAGAFLAFTLAWPPLLAQDTHLDVAKDTHLVAQDTHLDVAQDTHLDVAKDTHLEEVVVTAEHRTENLHDVAGALQVFTGEALEKRGADGFEDFVLLVPGLSFRDQGAGATRIAIRGISNVAASDFGVTTPVSTVGLYLNDVPIQGTSQLPNLNLYDLEQIEVLKGPQGTLYGEGAMGGAIRMTLAKPNATDFSARGEMSGSFTKAGGFNNGFRAAVNTPLVADRAALRLVGTYRARAGFINNIARGDKHANSSYDYAVRALVGASLNDTIKVELLAMFSDTREDDFPNVDSGLGDLELDSSEPRYNENDFRLYGLTVNADLGFAQLTSVTSRTQLNREFIDRLVFASTFFSQYGRLTGDPFYTETAQESFAQELRLVSAGDARFDWLVGAFYRDKDQVAFVSPHTMPGEHTLLNESLSAMNLPLIPDSSRITGGGDVGFRAVTDRYEQVALYAEVALALDQRWNFTLGARWFDEDVTLEDELVLYSVLDTASSPYRVVEEPSSDVLLKARLSYRMTADSLLFFTIAEGFRSGGINLQSAFGVGDLLFESDALVSYELGGKTTWNDGRLMLNGSVYVQDWEDIQSNGSDISPTTGSRVNFISNAGDAEVMGIEAELHFQASDFLTIGWTLGYADSELTSAIADAVVGASLPNVPQYTTSASVDYAFKLGRLGDGFARFDVQYSDDQFTRLQRFGAPTGAPVDAYWVGQFRLGFRNQTHWGAEVFIDNIWDERAKLGRGRTATGSFNSPDRFVINRPRTIGLVIKAAT